MKTTGILTQTDREIRRCGGHTDTGFNNSLNVFNRKYLKTSMCNISELKVLCTRVVVCEICMDCVRSALFSSTNFCTRGVSYDAGEDVSTPAFIRLQNFKNGYLISFKDCHSFKTKRQKKFVEKFAYYNKEGKSSACKILIFTNVSLAN